jgi:ferredoxin-NADP reductase
MAHSSLLTLPIREVVAATPRARIVRVELGGERFDYRPGQGVMVGLAGSKRRPYSIAAAPHDAHRDGCLELLIGTEGHTPEFQRGLTAGAWLDVEGPIGNFTFEAGPGESRFAFIAGGTGIGAIRSMLRHALRNPRHTAQLLYFTRDRDEFAYDAELRAMATAGRVDLHRSITRGLGDRGWTEGRGRPTHAQLLPIVRRGAAVCFICGPASFVLDARALLIDVGMPPERVRIEDWLMPRPTVAPVLLRSPIAAAFAS